jgi:hypothetical protein
VASVLTLSRNKEVQAGLNLDMSALISNSWLIISDDGPSRAVSVAFGRLRSWINAGSTHLQGKDQSGLISARRMEVELHNCLKGKIIVRFYSFCQV